MSDSDTTSRTDKSLSTIDASEHTHVTVSAVFDVSDLPPARRNYLETFARQLEREFAEPLGEEPVGEPVDDVAHPFGRERVGPRVTADVSDLSADEREKQHRRGERIEREMAAEVASAKVLDGQTVVEV